MNDSSHRMPQQQPSLKLPREILQLNDQALLKGCRIERFRGSGPGGQKRNKTESGIRITHLETGISGFATESRSQHENKARALKRLRRELALSLRHPIQDLSEWTTPNELMELIKGKVGFRDPRYWLAINALLDLYHYYQTELKKTAAHLEITTSQLSKILLAEDALMQKINEMRIEKGFKPLRR